MSRIYNKIAMHLDYEYDCDNTTFEDFLNSVKAELGWYDKAQTTPMFDFEELNYVSDDSTIHNGQWYIITDFFQTIDPDKLEDAFNQWLEIANDFYDDDVDEDEEIAKKQAELIKKVAFKIRNSNAI